MGAFRIDYVPGGALVEVESTLLPPVLRAINGRHDCRVDMIDEYRSVATLTVRLYRSHVPLWDIIDEAVNGRKRKTQ